ncbi:MULTISPECIES: hypothetical protein [unclassified Rhizobium]|uniref:hypothetical protein n=1 Tax=unclassified Rhizobium TaxID=2613769 RepID=UPI00115DD699|nr:MULTISPECIES: hypothetical protein [unclassified Rhizobium]TQX90263.1 hypothetical protein EQW76_11210 [Rhizobium sp. rho-13.1]TQY16213.1 hypothetical protein EQW74_10800 [Rhizobium sp. rho-1.1]
MAIDNDKMVALLAAFKQDIAFFAQSVFKSTLRPKQIEFAEAFQNNKRITFRGGVGFGKTHVMAVIVWWALFTHNNVQVTIFGPSDGQIKSGIWKELGILYGRMDPFFKAEYDYAATKITRVGAGSSAFAEYRLANKDNIETARGIHMTNNFVLVDEATGVPDEVFTVLGNIFTDPNPKLCLISNPSSVTGFFYDTWKNEDVSSIWTKVHGKMSDNPLMTDEQLREMTISYGGKGSREYLIHVEGEFPLQEEDGIISLASVISAIDNDDAVPAPGSPIVWGLDPAGSKNGDRSVLIKRQDNTVLEMPMELRGLDGTQLAYKIRDLYLATPKSQQPKDICIDANGIGHGVWSILKDFGLPVTDVVTQRKPTRKVNFYYNLRAQLWWEMREWFGGGNVCIPNHVGLQEELILPKYTDDSGKILVEDKKSIRKRGKASPDCADALALTFASVKTRHQGKYEWSKPIKYADVKSYE